MGRSINSLCLDGWKCPGCLDNYITCAVCLSQELIWRQGNYARRWSNIPKVEDL